MGEGCLDNGRTVQLVMYCCLGTCLPSPWTYEEFMSELLLL